MGCNCKQKYKGNNLDNPQLVQSVIDLYNQSQQIENGFEEMWNDIYAAFILVYPNTSVHTKGFVREQIEKLIKYKGTY